ncbi:MAG TPA: hypothetical protein VGK34_04945 [Armatimonadota bacterium]
MKRQQRNKNTDPSLKKARRGKPVLDRLCRGLAFLLAGCGVLACAYLVLAKASRPFMISYGESQEIAMVQKAKAAAEAENKRLKEQKKYLSTPQGKETEARKLGWVKDGEVAIVIEQPERESNVELDEPVEGKTAPKSRWRSVRDKALSTFLFRGRGGQKPASDSVSPRNVPMD